MQLSVIIPARNEEMRLPLALGAVAAYQASSPEEIEVIVVDGGSSDATKLKVEDFRDRFSSLRTLSVPDTGRRNNKGLAVRAGMLAANGELRCFIDADNAASFDQIELLLRQIPGFDLVIGSRYIPGGDPGPRSLSRRIVSRGGNLIYRHALSIAERDTHCPMKLYTASAARLLFDLSRIDGMGFDAEVLAIAARRGLRVAEVPVTWRHVEGGTVRIGTVLEALSEVVLIRRGLRHGVYDVAPLP